MALFRKRKLQASQNFETSMLPQTRKAIFFDVIKLHWSSFLSYGFLILLFMLPLYVITLAQQVLVWQQYALLEGLPDAEKLESIQNIYALQNTAACFKIPCLMIAALGLAGLIRVIRQYAWEENVFFSFDFSTGIKSNSKQFLLLGLLAGIINLLVTYYNGLSAFAKSSFSSILLTLPVGLALAVALPLIAFAMVSISIYSNKFSVVLMTSFSLSVKTFFKTIVRLLGILSPLALFLIPNLLIQFAVLLVYALAFPTLLLTWYLYALDQFDKHINAQYYPELVGKGLASSVSDVE